MALFECLPIIQQIALLRKFCYDENNKKLILKGTGNKNMMKILE